MLFKLPKIFNILKFSYQASQKPLPPNGSFDPNPALTISSVLNSAQPALISRIGGVETAAIEYFRKYGKLRHKHLRRLQTNAGFFINRAGDVGDFVNINLDALMSSDVVAYWDCRGQYNLFKDLQLAGPFIELKALEPFWVGYNWLSKLNRKRICIVSPFVETMQLQKRNIHLIHPKLHLEEHDFCFVKAPMTNAGYHFEPTHPSWFDNLAILLGKVESTDPDLVMIGAGSYGLPLGKLLKDAGYSSVVCGGSLQLLLGIKGSRWDQRADYQSIYNAYWTRLLPSETPVAHEKIEGGCYW